MHQDDTQDNIKCRYGMSSINAQFKYHNADVFVWCVWRNYYVAASESCLVSWEMVPKTSKYVPPATINCIIPSLTQFCHCKENLQCFILKWPPLPFLDNHPFWYPGVGFDDDGKDCGGKIIPWDHIIKLWWNQFLIFQINHRHPNCCWTVLARKGKGRSELKCHSIEEK